MEKLEIINKLKQLDLKTYPYFEIKELIRDMGMMCFMVMTLHTGKLITRARLGHNFTKASDLSYKPQVLNNTCQRASTPNSTMFYGCIVRGDFDLKDTRYIAACESSQIIRNRNDESETLEYITFGQWEVIKDINLIAVIHKDCFKEANNSLLKELNDAYETFIKLHPTLDSDIDAATDFLAKEFSKKNVDNKDYNYLISSVFTEVVISDHDYDGVMYPSVQAEGNYGFNVAIKPKSVDEKMKLNKILESKIIKKGKSIDIINMREGIVLEDSTISYR